MHSGMKGETMKTDKHITIGYNRINESYIRENGKESLLILSLLSRNLSVRSELVFNFKYLFDMIDIPKQRIERKRKIIEVATKMFSLPTCNDYNVLMNVEYRPMAHQYLILNDSEVDKILNVDVEGIDIYNLFNTYVVIKRFVNHKTDTSFPSIKKIMQVTNVSSNNSTINYIGILENLKMIECIRFDSYTNYEGETRRPNNEYKIIGGNKNET